MGVSCSCLVAVLVRCTVLCLSSVLTSVMPVLGQCFSLLLVLSWPLWPWVCVLYSFSYRLYMTKLPVSWEGGHVTSLSGVCTFTISFQCFLHFTSPMHSQHHLVSVFGTFLFPFTPCCLAGKSQSSLASLLHHSQHTHLPCHSYLHLPCVLSCLLLFLVQATHSVQPALSVTFQT